MCDICEHSNGEIQKCADAEIKKPANAEMHKYGSQQMRKYVKPEIQHCNARNAAGKKGVAET